MTPKMFEHPSASSAEAGRPSADTQGSKTGKSAVATAGALALAVALVAGCKSSESHDAASGGTSGGSSGYYPKNPKDDGRANDDPACVGTSVSSIGSKNGLAIFLGPSDLRGALSGDSLVWNCIKHLANSISNEGVATGVDPHDAVSQQSIPQIQALDEAAQITAKAALELHLTPVPSADKAYDNGVPGGATIWIEDPDLLNTILSRSGVSTQ